MTFPRFLDVAHTLLVEECQRAGMDLFRVTELMAEGDKPTEEKPKPRVPTPAENTESLKQLQVMLAGVKK